MEKNVIEVENLSKLYKLGTIGSGSLRRDFQEWIESKRSIDRAGSGGNAERIIQQSANSIWALKDINFELKKGEALGIIGSNGSGKSTLLKVISRIIQPTTGTVRGRGKVGSILEVGTGFHHELSGRENIYISGYTLGMNKQEVQRKFDEIVSFSGIEKFIDTPVKRYSSGMYVRLAFAVAAHLEPDILIVDEVLAVGDADFQRKCMGKMQEVSGKSERTILFVSHNMQAISNLCSRALLLNKGVMEEIGPASQVVNNYLASAKSEHSSRDWKSFNSAPGNDQIRLKNISVAPAVNSPDKFITVRTPIVIKASFWNNSEAIKLNINVKLMTVSGECIFNLGSHSIDAEKGILTLTSIIPPNLLNNSSYVLGLTVVKNHSQPVYDFQELISFEVEDIRDGMYYFGTWPGLIRPQIESRLSLVETTN